MSSEDNTPAHLSFWGTRGSISTPGRITEKYGGNTPCVSVHHGDTHIIFDAGTGIRNLGLELADEYAGRSEELTVHLFLSHTHWDHIQGLPFFSPAYMKGVKLIIYGSAAKAGFLENVLRGQMTFAYFPVDMAELTANITIREFSEPELQIDGFTVSWQEQMYHPGGCVRYALCRDGKRLVYASDVELNKFMGGKGHSEEEKTHAKDYMKFIRGADMLIADGQYTPDEYAKAVGWGHSTVPLLLQTAYKAKVKQLAIFHHDPQHSDKVLDELWREYASKYQQRNPAMQVFWAREGVTIPF